MTQTELFRDQVDIDKNGYIISGRNHKNQYKRRFAVGDVRTKPVRQIVTATADGAVASHFAEEYLSNI